MSCRNVRASFLLVSVVICLSVGSSYAQLCVYKFNSPFCPDCNNGPCFSNSGCLYYCARPAAERPAGPGFATVFKDGQFTVAQVFPNSPAQFSGVEVGDVVEQVDGKAVPLCYGSLEQQQRHSYTLKRNGRSFTIPVDSASVLDLIALAFQRNLLVNVSYPSRKLRVPQQPFLSGLITSLDSAGPMIVEVVLPGSPAAEAGIRAGDVITLITNPTDARTGSAIEGADYRAILRFAISRNGEARVVTLQLRSATHLLESLATSEKSSNAVVRLGQ